MANARLIATALSALGLAISAMPLSAAEPAPVAEAKAPVTAKLFGRWEVRPNNPFRDEDGPIGGIAPFGDAAPAANQARSGETQAARAASPVAPDGFVYSSEEGGWQLAARNVERRKR